jgi:cytochrome c-type biogenesis protein CcmH
MFSDINGSGDHVSGRLLSRLRARLQPGREPGAVERASAPEGGLVSDSEGVPHRLKPTVDPNIDGTAESLPLSKASLIQRVCSLPRLRWAQAILVFSLAVVMLGAGDSTASNEKRYDRIGHNMMCACGCGQILLECNHVGCPDSARMDKELRTMVNGGTVDGSASGSGASGSEGSGFGSGGSDKAILNWFVEKYGATVLASPIRGGFDDVAWIMPISVFLLAILGTAALIRIWKARSPERAPLKIKGMNASSTEELRERIRRETHY